MTLRAGSQFSFLRKQCNVEILKLEILGESHTFQKWRWVLTQSGSFHMESLLLFWANRIWNHCPGSPRAKLKCGSPTDSQWMGWWREAIYQLGVGQSHHVLGVMGRHKNWKLDIKKLASWLSGVSRHKEAIMQRWNSPTGGKFPYWRWLLSQLLPHSS